MDKAVTTFNLSDQNYRGIPIRLINRHYDGYQAMRFTLNGTNQNVWIPKKHLQTDGTLKPGEDIDYVMRSHCHQLYLAGITKAIPGIKCAGDESFQKHKERCKP